MHRFTFEPARAEDNDSILEIFRLPMGGSISVALERDPDYFAGAGVQNAAPRVFVGRDNQTGRITGTFSVGTRPVYVNRRITEVPYFCDLRILPEYRNGTLLARGYRFVRDAVLKDTYAQTLIVADNLEAVTALTEGRGGLPVYYPFGRYSTLAIPSSREKPPASVRRAIEDDLPAILEFSRNEAPRRQFYPHYSFDFLSPYFRGARIQDLFLFFDGQDLAGMCGVWNQKEFKSSRIAAYSPALRIVRPLYNLFAAVTQSIPLPPEGSLLEYSFIYSLLVRNDDARIFRDLLRAVRSSGLSNLYLLGLDESDPLAPAAQKVAGRRFRALHYLVSAADPRPGIEPGPFYLEAARL